jgi:DNA-directed RNA polymerase subunit RPC12/RpoP
VKIKCFNCNAENLFPDNISGADHACGRCKTSFGKISTGGRITCPSCGASNLFPGKVFGVGHACGRCKTVFVALEETMRAEEANDAKIKYGKEMSDVKKRAEQEMIEVDRFIASSVGKELHLRDFKKCSKCGAMNLVVSSKCRKCVSAEKFVNLQQAFITAGLGKEVGSAAQLTIGVACGMLVSLAANAIGINRFSSAGLGGTTMRKTAGSLKSGMDDRKEFRSRMLREAAGLLDELRNAQIEQHSGS